MFPRRCVPLWIVVLACGGADHKLVPPQIVYATYLGGRFKECSSAIAVDQSGNAYVAGRTPSPDFPVTAGAFSTQTRVNNDDWTGFVSKLSAGGDRLAYSTFLGGEFRSSANAIAVDAKGRAFVAGSTCSSRFPTTPTAAIRTAPGSNQTDACDSFVAWLNADGSRLEYGSYLGGTHEDAATAIALSRDENVVYVGGYSSSPDFPIRGAAVKSTFSGSRDAFLCAIDTRSGRLLYSTYLGGSGNDSITGIVSAPDGTVYVAGVTDSKTWPGIRLRAFGTLGGADGFVLRVDPAGRQPASGIRIGGTNDEDLAALAIDSNGDLYAAGATVSTNFPVAGVFGTRIGTGFLLKIDGRRFAQGDATIIWSRQLGGHGADALLSVAAGMPGYVFVAGRSGSKDFPATETAIHPRLQAENDSVLLQLRAADGKLIFGTFLGGTRIRASWYNDEAHGVEATSRGDVYVTGCTLDNNLPVTGGAFQQRPKGNSEPFVMRLKFYRQSPRT